MHWGLVGSLGRCENWVKRGLECWFQERNICEERRDKDSAEGAEVRREELVGLRGLHRKSAGPSRLPSKLGVNRVNKTAALHKRRTARIGCATNDGDAAWRTET